MYEKQKEKKEKQKQKNKIAKHKTATNTDTKDEKKKTDFQSYVWARQYTPQMCTPLATPAILKCNNKNFARFSVVNVFLVLFRVCVARHGLARPGPGPIYAVVLTPLVLCTTAARIGSLSIWMSLKQEHFISMCVLACVLL